MHARSGSGVETTKTILRSEQFKKAFQTVVDAYLLFDEDASGTVDRCAPRRPAPPSPQPPRDHSHARTSQR